MQGTVRALLLNEPEHWLNLVLTTMSAVPSIGQSSIPCAHKTSAATGLLCNTRPKLNEIVRNSVTSRGIRIGPSSDDHVESVEQLLRMEMDEFLALVLLRMDIWNSSCSSGKRMMLANYGEKWQIDHKLFLGGVAKDDIAGKLARCVGWLQQPLPNGKHAEKSHGERTHKPQGKIAAVQTDLANRVTEARAHINVSQHIYGSNSQNTMDSLEHLGDILLEAELHAEALEVEVVLRRIRASEKGWEAPESPRELQAFGQSPS